MSRMLVWEIHNLASQFRAAANEISKENGNKPIKMRLREHFLSNHCPDIPNLFPWYIVDSSLLMPMTTRTCVILLESSCSMTLLLNTSPRPQEPWDLDSDVDFWWVNREILYWMKDRKKFWFHCSNIVFLCVLIRVGSSSYGDCARTSF